MDRPGKVFFFFFFFLTSGCLLVQLEDGEVREDWEDRGGFLRRCVQVQEQRHGADSRNQEVCGVRGRSHHQKDCTEGDQDAQGYPLFLLPKNLCFFTWTIQVYLSMEAHSCQEKFSQDKKKKTKRHLYVTIM